MSKRTKIVCLVLSFLMISLFLYYFYSFDQRQFCVFGKNTDYKSDIENSYWVNKGSQRITIPATLQSCKNESEAGNEMMFSLYENLCRNGHFSEHLRPQAKMIINTYFADFSNNLINNEGRKRNLQGSDEEIFRRFIASGNSSKESQSFIEACRYFAPQNGVQEVRPWVLIKATSYGDHKFEQCMAKNNLVREIPQVKYSYCKGIGW